MSTHVLPCSCKNPYQDRFYGKGLRLHNDGVPASGQVKTRCSSCLSVQTVAKKESDEKKKGRKIVEGDVTTEETTTKKPSKKVSKVRKKT